MEWWLSIIILFSGLMLLLMLGIPVAFSFWIIVVSGFFFLAGGTAGLYPVIISLRSSIAVFTFLPVPLFIIMGDVLFQSGIGGRILDVFEIWLGRLPGRLSLVAVGVGTLFAALSGSSLGTTAMLSASLGPDMTKRGYDTKMIVGPIMAGGMLSVIIPPSILLVILGGLTGVSVAKLLLAGIIPGLLMSLLFCGYIVFTSMRNPSLIPLPPEMSVLPLFKKIREGIAIIPAVVIIFLVLGTIFLGIATPTEASALGAFGCYVLAFAQRRLNSWGIVKKIVMSSGTTTAVTIIIVTGSMAFSQLLALTGATKALMELATGLEIHPLIIISITLLILLLLGCFIDQISMLMIGAPIFVPLAEALGYDPIWYGLLFTIAITLGFLTPPFGMLFFVVKGTIKEDISMGTIYRSGVPYVILGMIALIILMFIPKLVTWLPALMD
jgi:tripartite ATP-independent transporter DctM subunit